MLQLPPHPLSPHSFPAQSGVSVPSHVSPQPSLQVCPIHMLEAHVQSLVHDIWQGPRLPHTTFTLAEKPESLISFRLHEPEQGIVTEARLPGFITSVFHVATEDTSFPVSVLVMYSRLTFKSEVPVFLTLICAFPEVV
jgi:hypothetical protein